MVRRRRFFCVQHFQRAAYSTSQTYILNSHYGYTMCGSMADIQSPIAEIRRGKKEEKATQLQFTYLLHVSHVMHQTLIGYISLRHF